jgi:hypothetical protein
MRCTWLLLIAACGQPATTIDGATTDGVAHDSLRPDGVTVDDGTPMRLPCTNQFGTALTQVFGRLDGFLVAIVAPGGGGCNADSSHLHLQIRASGSIYDVAVNVGSTGMEDVHTTTRELTMPGPAWSEGWHPGLTDDYVALGVHAPDLVLETRAQLTSEVTADLASANHISVFATGYGGAGVHLVHHNGSNRDGLVVTRPLSNPSHARMFSFSNQVF